MEIKICGLKRPVDIDYVNEARPDYVGFIINVPKSHRSVDQASLAKLSAQLRPEIAKVGVFVDEPMDGILTLVKEGLIDIVQLHGRQDEAFIQALQAQTTCPVWKAFSIENSLDVERAEASSADMVLLDQGSGGTGQAFDWSLIANFQRPYFLAGGLNEESLPRALEVLKPQGVDVSSGVETNKVKDREKIMNLVRMVKEYDR